MFETSQIRYVCEDEKSKDLYSNVINTPALKIPLNHTFLVSVVQ